MIIYRVEHLTQKSGNVFAGPYLASGHIDSKEWDINDDHLNMDTHPNPFFDSKLKKHFPFNDCYFKQYRSGFKSIDQLKSWFNDDQIRRLMSLGFVIVKYNVPNDNVICGKKSLVFRDYKISKRTVIYKNLKSF